MFSASLLESRVSCPVPPHPPSYTATTRLNLGFNWSFLFSSPLGSPQRVVHQDWTLERCSRLLALAPALSLLHQARFFAWLPSLKFHSCLDLCLPVCFCQYCTRQRFVLLGEGLRVLVGLYHPEQCHANTYTVEWTFPTILFLSSSMSHGRCRGQV